jgi:hypothetical protein
MRVALPTLIAFLQYETQFVDDTQREINRWKSGGCAGIQPVNVRRKSPMFGVHIVSVRGRGARRAKSSRSGTGRAKAISFRKASLTN